MSNKYTSWLNDINEQTEKPIEHQLDKNEVISKYEFNFEVDEETARTDVEGFVGALYEHGLVLDE